MTNIGVPNTDICTKYNQLTFHTKTSGWECKLCGKTEKPQDHTNMGRHIWWHLEKPKSEAQKAQGENLTPITHTQQIRIETLLLREPTQLTCPTTQEPETQDSKKPTNNEHKDPTIWGQLEHVIWNKQTDNWK